MVESGCTLTISGGEIKNNEAINGGGIWSDGALIINDGTISGNEATIYGGGLYVNGGSAIINGGSITDNITRGFDGGGIGINNRAVLNLYGGTITGNVAHGKGGGIYVDDSAANVNIQGSPVVKDNKAYTSAPNVGLKNGRILAVAGALADDALIRVATAQSPTMAGPVVITGGLDGNGTAEQFASDNEDYVIGLNADGEAIVCVKATVTYAPGDESATGTLDAWTVGGGTMFTLSDCGYELAGRNFVEWSVRIGSAEPVAMAPATSFRVTGNTTVTAVWSEPVHVIATGASGSFNEKIKMNYYFDIPDDILADEDAYVTLTNENTERSVTLPVANAEFVAGKGYKFSIPMAAKEAGDFVAAKFFNGQGETVAIIGGSGTDYTETGLRYTLMQYFTWLEANSEDAGEKALGAAAKDYCSAAMIYFDYNADGVTVSGAVDEVTEENLAPYVAGRDGTLPAGVSIHGITAMLESDNTLRLQLKFKGVDPGDLTFKIDGNAVNLKQRADGVYYLALDTGVWSNRLQGAHDYTVSDGTNTFTATASVLTYAKACAASGNETAVALGKALYLYNRAAVRAFGN